MELEDKDNLKIEGGSSVDVALPSKLSIFKDSNYIEQGRAKLVWQFIFLAQMLYIGMVPIQITQFLVSERWVELLYIGISLLAVGVMFYIKSVLRRGMLRVASNLLAIAVMLLSWTTLFLEQDADFSVLNNLFYVYVAMFVLPLVLPNKRTAYAVVGVNIVVMLLFWFTYKDDIAAMGQQGLDTILDFIFSQLGASILIIYAHANYEQELRNHTKFVTTQIALRNALEQQTLTYSQFLNTFPECIFSLDADGNITFLNDVAYRLLGFSSADLDKHNVFDMLQERDRYRLKRSLQRNTAGKITMGSDYSLFVNGKQLWFKFFISRLIEDGKCVGVEGIALDIASQKAMEQELRHRDELVQLISNETGNVIIICDATGKIEMANRSFFRAGVVQRESVEGCNLYEFALTKGLPDAAQLSAIIERGYQQVTDIHVRLSDGDELYYSCTIQPVWSMAKPLLLINMNDITEQRKTMVQLEERKQEMERMLATLPNMVLLSDVEDKVVWCNNALLAFLGITMEQVEGKSLFSIVKTETLTNRDVLWNHINERGMVKNLEMEFSDFKGNFYQVLISSSILEFSGRKLLLSSMTDASVVKRNERMLNDMLMAMPNMVTIMDRNLSVRWANQAFLDFMETTSYEVEGKTLYEMVRLGTIQSPVDIRQTILEKGFIRGMGVQCEDTRGRKFSVVLSGVTIRYDDQDMFLFTVVDTSERDRLEQELRKSEDSMVSVLNSIPNMVLVVNYQKIVRWANSDMCEFMGCTLQEAIGKHMYDVAPPNSVQPADKIWGGLKNDGYIRNLPVTFQNIAGHTHSGLASALPIEMAGEPCVIALIVDTTEHDELEAELASYRETLEIQVAERTDALQSTNEELISTNEALIESNRLLEVRNTELQDTMEALKEAQNQLVQSEKMSSLGLLASGIAHEINNPLNYIRGGIQGIENLIDDGVIEQSPEIKLLIGAVHEGINRAATIVKGMGRYSRSSSRNDEHCDIHSILSSCVVLLHSQIKGNVKLTRHFSAEKLEVLGNEGKLHQVFVNIIQNAIHAVGDGGKIDIETYRTGQYVVVQVRDTGVGISEEVRAHMFDPFFTTKPPGQGTGLGLAISQKIIMDHGGQIDVASQEGHGTTVSIHLPLLKTEASS